MEDRVGQTWRGLVNTEPSRLLLVVRMIYENVHHYGYVYRTYACLDLETGELLERSESARLPWEYRNCQRVM